MLVIVTQSGINEDMPSTLTALQHRIWFVPYCYIHSLQHFDALGFCIGMLRTDWSGKTELPCTYLAQRELGSVSLVRLSRSVCVCVCVQMPQSHLQLSNP